MLLLRLLTTGVCVVCVVMLATKERGRVQVQPDLARYLSTVDGYGAADPRGAAGSPRRDGFACADRQPPVSVLDVAHGVAPDELAGLVHLRPAEWVSAINDRPLDPDLPVGYLIAAVAPHAGDFLDLTVSSPTGERRVLVLIH
jgi:hypothetical protein